MSERLAWGWHTIVDASHCDHQAITDYDTIYRFTKQLVNDIDMVPFGEPHIVHFGSEEKAGYTMVQLIETSNIVAHFANDIDAVFLDCFSCKEYDPTIVEKLVKEYFRPEHIDLRVEDRGYAKVSEKASYNSILAIQGTTSRITPLSD